MENREPKLIDLDVSDFANWEADFIPNSVQGYSWEQAAADLRHVLRNVPSYELSEVVNALRAGKINGNLPAVAVSVSYPEHGACGCIIATIGRLHGQTMVGDWKAFILNYGVTSSDTPFQHWLFGVHPGDTPENNTIAAAFVRELEAMIVERKNTI